MRTANNDTKLHGAITTRDLARLRDGLKVGQKVPCIIEIPCEGRGERERFFRGGRAKIADQAQVSLHRGTVRHGDIQGHHHIIRGACPSAARRGETYIIIRPIGRERGTYEKRQWLHEPDHSRI